MAPVVSWARSVAGLRLDDVLLVMGRRRSALRDDLPVVDAHRHHADRAAVGLEHAFERVRHAVAPVAAMV